jgi:hypothetical protein
MPAIANSKTSPASKRPKRAGGSALAALAVAVALAALSAAAIAVCYAHGWLLYYGDATAHLNIARRVLDSRTPGPEQIGTVWLPLPHLLMMPLAGVDRLWRSGLAGSIPAGACFVIAGVLFFLAGRRAFGSAAAGAAATMALALNPNLLYLQSTAMTEPVFLAALAGLLFFSIRFYQEQDVWSVAGAGAATLAATLTRYEGWFLIPFATAYFLIAARRRRLLMAFLFGAIASLGPVAWLAHNAWYYSNPLEFYNGPYSARAIYQRARDAGMAPSPGDGDWRTAWLYFRTAVMLCLGTPLAWLGLAGAVAALLKRTFWPLLLLALPPAFYVWSLHSAGTPIFVPQLWPHSYYNTRYALAALPLAAFGAAALVALAPARLRGLAALAVVAAAVSPWLAYPRPQNWICWKESEVNSQARRAWTSEAADFLEANRRPEEGVLAPFGDLTGIFQQAGIPLRETLHEGNQLQWISSVNRPDLFLREDWIVAFSGDKAAVAATKTPRTATPRYDLMKTITRKGAPVIEIYRRSR